MARATVEVTADVARYQAELAKIPGMTDKEAAKAALKLQQRMEKAADQAAKQAARATKEAEQAASRVAKFAKSAELLERMRAALGPMGDALGDITGGMDDLGTALDGFSKKQIAAAGATILVVAGMAKLGSAVLDVITNFDEYRDTIERLERSGNITAAQVEGLKEAGAAVQVLKEQFSDLVVELAANVAPLMENLSRGIYTAAAFMRGGWEAAIETAQEFNRRQREIKQEQDKRRQETEQAEEEATKKHEQRTTRKVSALERLQAAQAQLQSLISAARMQEANERDKILLQYQQQLEQVNALIEQHPQLAGQAEELIEIYQKQRDAAIAAFDLKERQAYEAEEAARAQREQRRIEETTAAYREQQQAMQEAQQAIMQASFESAASIAGNIQNTLSSVTEMFDTSTKQGKKAARSMAEAQRVLAIFQVGINLAQAIAQSLAQGGPVAGAALAAAVTAAFAGIIATVSRPVPQFHTGRFGAASGMLGDERMTGGVMTVQPEVVIPPDLVSRAGGADGVRSRLEDDRPLIVQAVIDLADERIVLPLSRAMGARERTKLGVPLGRS